MPMGHLFSWEIYVCHNHVCHFTTMYQFLLLLLWYRRRRRRRRHKSSENFIRLDSLTKFYRLKLNFSFFFLFLLVHRQTYQLYNIVYESVNIDHIDLSKYIAQQLVVLYKTSTWTKKKRKEKFDFLRSPILYCWRSLNVID